jgi:hypothetical protein
MSAELSLPYDQISPNIGTACPSGCYQTFHHNVSSVRIFLIIFVFITITTIPVGNKSSLTGLRSFEGGTGPIFSIYLEITTEDKTMAESWKADSLYLWVFIFYSNLMFHTTDSSVINRFILY